MKKIISFISVCFVMMLLMPISNAYNLSTVAESYEGIENYKAIYQNSNFMDIQNSWAKKPIVKMSALSIIKEMGSNHFYPNNKLTKEEAVILLVRLMGLDGDAQTIGEKLIKEIDTGKYSFYTPQDYWMEGYIKAAQGKNIITKEETDEILKLSDKQKENIEKTAAQRMLTYAKDENLSEKQLQNIEKTIREKLEKDYTWKTPVNREQIAIWVGRMLELEPVNGSTQHLVYTLKDWKSIQTASIPIIEAILQKGIIKGNKGYFKPKDDITKAEMAGMLDKASEEMLIKRGFKILSGNVYHIENFVTSQQDSLSTNYIGVQNSVFTVKNEEGTYINLIAKESTMETFNKGFLVYRKGNLCLPKDIKVNDYIKYILNEKNEVVFVEVE